MTRFSRLLSKQAAVPIEHGSWVFLFSPLLIGISAVGEFRPELLLVCLAALSGFMARQPLTLLIKIISRRRPRVDLPAALFWLSLYSLAGAVLAGMLFARGYAFILWLALPAAPVLAWHLWLVSRREERKNPPVEIAGSGILALVAPAVYWAGSGKPDWTGILLWGLCWIQAAVSILYAFLRLEQRKMERLPVFLTNLRMAAVPLIGNCLALILVAWMASLSWVSPWLIAAFAVQLVEVFWGILRPALGVKPVQIGVRQLVVSSMFTLVFILAW